MTAVRVLAILACAPTIAAAQPAFFPAEPDIHGDTVVFVSEGDLWRTTTAGGEAVRLTTWPGIESRPRLSPDGKHIAFSASYDGSNQVYVMPTEGGQPVRWTWDPSGASPVDWKPSGSLLIRTRRGTVLPSERLAEVSGPGAMPSFLPIPVAAAGNYKADGTTLAYTRVREQSNVWVQYRGGQQNDLYTLDLATGRHLQLTSNTHDETEPLWVGSQLYFRSEEDGTGNLWSVDPATKKRTQVTRFKDTNLWSPQTDGKRIVYVRGTQLELFDQNATKTIPVRLPSERIHTRPYLTPLTAEEFAIGPTGKRVLVTSRGQIFSAPAQSGDVRAILTQPGTRNSLPRWSPDGTTLYFLSDRSDEWNLHKIGADGAGEPEQITKLSGRVFQALKLSPNGKFALLLDGFGELLKVDLETGATESIHQDQYSESVSFDISSNSRFIAYVAHSHHDASAAWVLDTSSGKRTRMSQPWHRDQEVAFDRSGRLLYVLGQRRVQMQWDPFDFQMNGAPASRIVAFQLTKEPLLSLLPKVDEEPLPGGKGLDADPNLTFDLEGAAQRTFEINGVSGDANDLAAGKEIALWREDGDLKRWSANDKKVETVGSGVSQYVVATSGEHLLARRGGNLIVANAKGSLGETAVPLGGVTVTVDPKLEWKHALREAWRAMRDTFYAENLHGANWETVWQRAEKMLPAVGHRSELTRLIQQIQAELDVSHLFAGGGTVRLNAPPTTGTIGMLGCDFAWEEGALKVTKVLQTDGFFDTPISPLRAIDVDIRAGDYIFSINGKPVEPGTDPYKMLDGLAGRLIRIETNRTRSLEGLRTVYLRPLSSENSTRYTDWIVSRLEYVQAKGGSNLGYVHIPDMGEEGMQQFAKYFYSQLDKDGIVIDVRGNAGGIINAMILERLNRVIYEYDQARRGAPVPYHRHGVIQKFIVLCDENTASDGEYFCTGFRAMKLGPVVGKRTWGGFAGVGGVTLVDGGFVSIPAISSYDPSGKWFPDGTGFTPDIEVDQDPAKVNEGQDPQLDRALDWLKAELKKSPVKRPTRQAPPRKRPA